MSQINREYRINTFASVFEKNLNTEIVVFNYEKSVDSIRLNPYNKRDGGRV